MRRNAVRLVEDVLPAAEHAVVAVGRRTGLELVLTLLAVLLVIAHPQRWYTFALGTFEHSAGAWHGGAVSIRIWKRREKSVTSFECFFRLVDHHDMATTVMAMRFERTSSAEVGHA